MRFKSILITGLCILLIRYAAGQDQEIEQNIPGTPITFKMILAPTGTVELGPKKKVSLDAYIGCMSHLWRIQLFPKDRTTISQPTRHLWRTP
jgi:hypothetical protein